MKEVSITQDDLYAARIFFNAALPLLKVVIQSKPNIKKKFEKKNFVFQVSALYDMAPGGKMATHLVFNNGEITVKVSEIHPKPDIEFVFPDIKKFIIFFSGKGMPLPKMKGIVKNMGSFMAVMQGLLTMSKLLGSTDAPVAIEDQELLVKLFFYLLPNGISQLNKAGHEKIHDFALKSPDRAYAFAVTGYPALNSYIRFKEGNSKAGRGEYPRCKPFLTLRFDSVMHALDILMSKGDMVDYMANDYLKVEGAPEFAGIVGEFMFVIGDYAKAAYMD
ncbi:MAG: hypothetical protein CVU91_07020 [Firmicutes bacterium HGW-Firmicutes-16]|nr:MAG: hypothetical protein CVU91_07020 [Firmicutes bacterium HGW-Firmicutes-16]